MSALHSPGQAHAGHTLSLSITPSLGMFSTECFTLNALHRAAQNRGRGTGERVQGYLAHKKQHPPRNLQAREREWKRDHP